MVTPTVWMRWRFARTLLQCLYYIIHTSLWVFTRLLLNFLWLLYDCLFILIAFTFTTLWAISGEDTLMIFFFQKNRLLHFMQIVSLGFIHISLTFVTLWANSTDSWCCFDKSLKCRGPRVRNHNGHNPIQQLTCWWYFLFQKIGFDISYKLETIYWNVKAYFLWKIRKTVLKCWQIFNQHDNL